MLSRYLVNRRNLANYLVNNDKEDKVLIYACRKGVILVLEKVLGAKTLFIETGDIP